MTAEEPRPRYRTIADSLRGRIADGTYKQGGKLPSERKIAEEMDVSCPTVRDALAALREEGLVSTARGRGTFVSGRPAATYFHHAGLVVRSGAAFAGEVAPAAATLTERIDSTGIEAPPASVAQSLRLRRNQKAGVWRWARLLDGTPVQLVAVWASAEASRAVNAGPFYDSPDALVGLLAKRGPGLAHFQDRVSGRMPERAERLALKLPVDIPLMTLESVACSSTGQVTSVSVIAMPAEAFVLSYRVTPEPTVRG